MRRSNSIKTRRLAWVAAGLFLLVVAAAVGARVWFNAYLRGAEFRALLSRLTARELRAAGEFRPFRFAGTTIYSDGFNARGMEGAFFSALDADQLRADFDPGSVFDGVWRVRELLAQRVVVSLGGDRVGAPAPAPASREPSGGKRRGLLPDRAEILGVNVRDTGVKWEGGSLAGVALLLKPDGAGWLFEGAGGTLAHGSLPPLELKSARLRYQKPSLHITSAEFSQDRGSVSASGEVDFGKGVALDVRLAGVPVTPLLPEDWRARLHGELRGGVRVEAALPPAGGPVLSGTVALDNGRLETLPVLDQIATFTSTRQFRTLQLSRCTAEFTHRDGVLTARNFTAESQGLICLRGQFTVKGGDIEGTFDVGVTPASLRWLPGSRTQVFTESRDGYLWTKMKVTGPLKNPAEDLTPRLVAAAQGTVIEGAHEVIETGTNIFHKATEGVFDLLLK
jgi:hypothetical protein